MAGQALQAISPIDGRYASKTASLIPFFSEQALIKYRVKVEIEYFIALVELPLPQLVDFDTTLFDELRCIYTGFSGADAQHSKDKEKVTNHDVKAGESFTKDTLEVLRLLKYHKFKNVDSAGTEQQQTAIPLSLKEAIEQSYLPTFSQVHEKLKELSKQWKDIAMLARTHGQPASPTRLGKEIQVYVVRLEQQLEVLKNCKHAAKFGGATGNFNAHLIAYPKINWKEFGQDFVEKQLGLHHSFPTTQIEHYDHMAGLFDCLKRINTIILDLDRDIWSYVSMDYFKQKIKKGEIGSSAMPHKVNPIDFENSEGNLGIANAIFEHLSSKLPVSRLQRDLTDSTVLRNIGVPIGHTLIALQSTLKGLDKLLLNESKFKADLENNWAVVAEALQTILRREGYQNPYEALKGLTRTNETISKTSIADFIETLDVSSDIKKEMRAITPENYTGI